MPQRKDLERSPAVSEIVRNLAKTPAYLLVFGIAFLVVLLASVFIAANLQVQHPEIYLALSLLSLIVALLVSLPVIRIMEAGRIAATLTPKPADVSEPPQTGEPRIDASLNHISENLRRAVQIQHPVFLDEIAATCNDFAAQSTDWRQGQVVIPAARYNEILHYLYENAKESVFATSIPEYFAAWTSALGEELLEAHRRSRARVIRVFVFDNVTDIKPEELKEMARQKATQIEVRIYLDNEDKFFNFPPDVSRDFTIIDDEVIGITRSYGRDNFEAVWYFQDKTRQERFLRIRESLLNHSRTLEQLQQRYTDFEE